MGTNLWDHDKRGHKEIILLNEIVSFFVKGSKFIHSVDKSTKLK